MRKKTLIRLLETRDKLTAAELAFTNLERLAEHLEQHTLRIADNHNNIRKVEHQTSDMRHDINKINDTLHQLIIAYGQRTTNE